MRHPGDIYEEVKKLMGGGLESIDKAYAFLSEIRELVYADLKGMYEQGHCYICDRSKEK